VQLVGAVRRACVCAMPRRVNAYIRLYATSTLTDPEVNNVRSVNIESSVYRWRYYMRKRRRMLRKGSRKSTRLLPAQLFTIGTLQRLRCYFMSVRHAASRSPSSMLRAYSGGKSGVGALRLRAVAMAARAGMPLE